MANQEYDSPWKEAIENYFQECLEFFFPLAANNIDWQRGYIFLDKELQRIVRDAELGSRYVDKLLELQPRWAELEASNNPFATVAMAHLKAKATSQNAQERQRWKLYLTKRLYERGYEREQIINLFRFIDWIMDLPPELEEGFREEIEAYEEEKRMRYVTSIERIGIEKGKQEGLREGLIGAIELGLELKFGSAGLQLLPEISQIQDMKILETIKARIKTASSLTELQQVDQ